MNSETFYQYRILSIKSKAFLALLGVLTVGILIPHVQGYVEARSEQKRLVLWNRISEVRGLELLIAENAAPGTHFTYQQYAPLPQPYLPPIFQRIAQCESGGKQFHSNGAVVRGHINPSDIGKYQINSTIWGPLAHKLGHNLFTEEGNTAMALELYRRHGVGPWYLSSHCWAKI